MKKLLKYTACLALLVMAVGLLTGCCPEGGKVTGGGWFLDNGEDKVTFGFNAQGEYDEDEEGYVFKGQFQAVNHGTGDKLHANEIVGKDLDGIYAKFKGVDKDGEVVTVRVWDLGEPGASVGDHIKIKCQYGTWKGFLEGGNIKIH